MRAGVPILAAVVLLQCACGYVKSGTWEDDPGNWNRAFHSTKPPDVEVLHSKYWRGAHFTLEFSYYFEIKANDALREQLFSSNTLIALSVEETTGARQGLARDAPPWFCPVDISRYDAWTSGGDKPRSPFVLFIDRETGNLFLAQEQL